MTKQLYRVELIPTAQKEVDTNKCNYGKGLDFEYYEHFFSVYDSIMDQVNIPVDFLVSVNNQIYASGGDFVEVLKNCLHNDYVDIYQVTNIAEHRGYKMPIYLMNEFLQSFDEENQFIWFDNGTFLWEYFYEKVREEEFDHLPRRTNSTFFFETIENCNYFIKNQLGGIGLIHKVELVETTNLFQGDMSIMDAIQNSISRDELIEVIRNYWKGEKTDNPIMETVFQGKYQITC